MNNKKAYYSNVSKILITKPEIQKAIELAAKWIDEEYKNVKDDIVLVGILKGCVPFMGQLTTQIERDVSLDFMLFSSFRGTNKAQSLPELIKDIEINIKDKHVLLVEDIIDSGHTILYAMKKLKEKKPASMKLITFLNKVGVRKVDLEPNYSCFEIPNEFIVGYGLDYEEKCRNWEFIGVLKKEYIK
ncbi:MAG: hypoxanthine phosphoribosyltransferase [Mycoplasmoidaceae bacterium]